MSTANMDHLRFPIGKFNMPSEFSEETVSKWISEIKSFPQRLKQAISNFTTEDFQNTYRPEGWTAAQVIHHCADSHLHAYIRTKLALTEDSPVVKPYEESDWAKMPDAMQLDVTSSVALLESLHHRWVETLSPLDAASRERTYFHPQHQKTFPVNYLIGLYAWHGNHHLAHVNLCKK